MGSSTRWHRPSGGSLDARLAGRLRLILLEERLPQSAEGTLTRRVQRPQGVTTRLASSTPNTRGMHDVPRLRLTARVFRAHLHEDGERGDDALARELRRVRDARVLGCLHRQATLAEAPANETKWQRSQAREHEKHETREARRTRRAIADWCDATHAEGLEAGRRV